MRREPPPWDAGSRPRMGYPETARMSSRISSSTSAGMSTVCAISQPENHAEALPQPVHRHLDGALGDVDCAATARYGGSVAGLGEVRQQRVRERLPFPLSWYSARRRRRARSSVIAGPLAIEDALRRVVARRSMAYARSASVEIEREWQASTAALRGDRPLVLVDRRTA